MQLEVHWGYRLRDTRVSGCTQSKTGGSFYTAPLVVLVALLLLAGTMLLLRKVRHQVDEKNVTLYFLVVTVGYR